MGTKSLQKKVLYRLLFVFIAIQSITAVNGQTNLVGNASFDGTACCPSAGGQWNCMSGWNNVNLNTGIGLWGTPDFLHSCGTGNTAPPATFAGTCNTHSGNGMAALVVYNTGYANYREYLSRPLTCTMVPGNTYTVSFWITNGTGIKSPWTVSNFGILFTVGTPTQSGYAIISGTPQCEVTSNITTTVWTQYTFTVNPSASWTHLTIGNFRQDTLNNVTLGFTNPGGPASAYANYFIDDIAVMANTSTSTLSAISTQSCLGLASATVSSSGSTVVPSYTWLPGNYSTSVVNNLPSGTYTVLASYSAACAYTASVVHTVVAPPPLTLVVSPVSPSVCAGKNILLTGSATGGSGSAINYTWSSGPQTATLNSSSLTPGTITYTLMASDGGLCNATKTIAVTHAANPTVSTTGSGTICPGNNTTLTASGASVYNWSPGSGTNSLLVVNPSVLTNYSVLGTAANGCTSSATATIDVFPQPALSFNTFSITCGSLGMATVNASGGLGPFSFTWMPTGFTSSVVNGMYPGTHTVVIEDAGTGCTFYPTTYFAPLVPLTGTVSSTPTVLCFGDLTATASIVLSNGSGTQSYVWSSPGASQTSSTATLLGAAVHTVVVTDALTFCQVNHTFVVTGPPQIIPSLSANSPSVCLGGAIDFSSSISGGVAPLTLTWTNGPGTATYQVNEIAAGTYVYTLTVTDNDNCVSSSTIAADFVPHPALVVSRDSICPLETGAIVASGATSFTWSNGANTNVIALSPSVTTVYTVNAEALGCTSTGTTAIVVKPLPNAFAASNSPRCPGDNLLMLASGGVNYLWTGPQGFTSTIGAPAITQVGNQNAGAYDVTVTAANSCTSSTSLTVVVNPSPTVSAIGAIICAGQSTILNSASVPGAVYQWSGPLGFISNLQNALLSAVPLNAGGTYTVKATNGFGCSASAIATLQVVPPPNLQYARSNSSICAMSIGGSPNSVIINASGAQGYTLNVPSPLKDSILGNNSFLVSTTSPFVPTGPITMTLLGWNGVCAFPATIPLSIVPNPVVQITSPLPLICAGESFSCIAGGAQSYTWNSTTPGYATLLNGTGLIVNPSNSTTISVTGSSAGCISYPATIDLTVNPIPVVQITPGSNEICIHNTATLQVSGTASTFAWNPPTGLDQTLGELVLASPLTDQVYTVVGTALNCSNSAVTSVKVLNLPLVTASVNKPQLCANDVVKLYAGGAGVYNWNGPGGIRYSGAEVTFTLTDINFAGQFTVVGTDNKGCVNQATVNVKAHPLPVGSMPALRNGCIPLCSDVSFYSSTPGVKMLSWDVSGSGVKKSLTSFCLTQFGDFNVRARIIDTNTQCMNTQEFNVSAYQKPVAGFEWSPEEPVAGEDDIQFINTSVGFEQTKWKWYFRETGEVNEGENVWHFYPGTGNYMVVMRVENSWGCADTVIKMLDVKEDFVFYIPNAFTPNKDQINEVFKPVIKGVKLYYFQVFDRWGERLFLTENTAEGWDGSYKGKTLKSDIYVWKVVLSTIHGEQKEYTGTVMLMK